MYTRVKGPNKVGHQYMPVYHGRKAKKRDEKSKFIINEDEEFELFNLADEHNVSPVYGQFDIASGLDYTWINDDHVGLFAVKRNVVNKQAQLDVIGENGERFAFFPAVVNMTDAWHGYPVMASNPDRPLGVGLMNYLHDIGYLSKIDIVRIKRKVL